MRFLLAWLLFTFLAALVVFPDTGSVILREAKPRKFLPGVLASATIGLAVAYLLFAS